MPIDDSRLPPLRTLQAALQHLTESLASELVLSLDVPPAWSELEWQLAPAAAAMHGISPLLASVLRWRGPAQWSYFLAEQRRHTLLRQARIAELLARIDERARSAGITVLPLKGAALHAAGIYKAGERPMADVDLLVQPADRDIAVAVLLALSYRDAGTTWKHHGFEPSGAERRASLGEHADNPIKIDLHVRIAERLPMPAIDLTDLVYRGGGEPGLSNYPSTASLMAHVLAHTAGSMTHRGVRLIQLCDISRLAARMTAADWEELAGFHGREGRLWWAAAPLILTERYFPKTIPGEIIGRLEHGCPWLIRRVARHRTLTDFSYCHLYIDPIPGIVWARSPFQTWRYLLARAFPSREQLEQMELEARTEPWASEPDWYRASQSRRVLRWLSSRPTRTETMQPVRAALARTG